jgi:hypothetical protein
MSLSTVDDGKHRGDPMRTKHVWRTVVALAVATGLLATTVGCGGGTSTPFAVDTGLLADGQAETASTEQDGSTTPDATTPDAKLSDIGPDPFEAGCEGVALAGDGVLDLDLRAIRARGKVTVNGRLLPSEAAVRTGVLFTERASRHTVRVPLRTSSDYEVVLAPGAYDVSFVGDQTQCARGPLALAPCNSGIVLSDVRLENDGVLDLDVRAVRVRGTVTLAGAEMTSAPVARGAVAFARSDGATVTTGSFGTTGPASYDLLLLAGRYDVSFVGNPTACPFSSNTGIPCNAGVVRAGVSVADDGVLDLDLRRVRVTGRVTVRGQALPDADRTRGALSFVRSDGGAARTSTLGTNGPGAYDITLLAGTYDVAFEGNEALCIAVEPPAIPCNTGTVRTKIALTNDGLLDVDLSPVRVRGAVTLGGAQLPDAASRRGALTFERSDGRPFTVNFVAAGPARYDATLLAGKYDVIFAGDGGRCGSDWALPCNTGRVRSGVALTTDGVLDVDLRAARIRGSVTVAGAPMPASASERGWLAFRLDGRDAAIKSFGNEGPATFDVTLLIGKYEILFHGNEATCGRATGVPCNVGVVRAATTLTTDGALDLDLPVARVRGVVTLGGAALPDASESLSRGSLAFALRDGSRTTATRLGTSGRVRYDVTLLAGPYVVTHVAPPRCSTAVPCIDQILRGCSR